MYTFNFYLIKKSKNCSYYYYIRYACNQLPAIVIIFKFYYFLCTRLLQRILNTQQSRLLKCIIHNNNIIVYYIVTFVKCFANRSKKKFVQIILYNIEHRTDLAYWRIVPVYIHTAIIVRPRDRQRTNRANISFTFGWFVRYMCAYTGTHTLQPEVFLWSLLVHVCHPL